MTPSHQTWLAAYLFYEQPWQTFLTEAVRPFVAAAFEQRLAQQFFFIRYWQRGPHIRLRFKGEQECLTQRLRPMLVDFFESYFARHPSRRVEPGWTENIPDEQRWFPNNSVQFVTYNPEVDRYGGPTGILIAEKQFEASSRVVLDLISAGQYWDYDRALGAAIQLHLGFAWALGMDLMETKQFYTRVFQGWFSRAYGFRPDLPPGAVRQRQTKTLEAFAANFERQKEMLVPFHRTVWQAFGQGVMFEQEWFNNWLQQMSTIGRELKKAQVEGRLFFPADVVVDSALKIPASRQKLWLILSSYVHMTNNRLGILNQDEAYLGYLIKVSLEELSR